MLYEMKLTNAPNQDFVLNNILINGVNRSFKVLLSYREICGYWTMSLIDQSNQQEIISNMPLITGVFLNGAGNMLAQMGYMDLGQIGVFANNDNSTDYPNNTNLESDFSFFWRYN